MEINCVIGILLIFFGEIHELNGLSISTMGMGRKLYHGPSWNDLSSRNRQCGVAHRLSRESTVGIPGERAARIVGGFPVEAPIPWQVIIQRKDEESAWKYICGGVLISEHHILTAAHCLPHTVTGISSNHRYRVTLGKHQLESSSPYEQTYEIFQSNIVAHRRYGTIAEYANDIAILKVENSDGGGVKMNEHVHPICLPDHVNWELQVMEPNFGDCIVSGFGTVNGSFQDALSKNLRAATVPIHSYEKCNKLYNKDPVHQDGTGEYSFLLNNRLRSMKIGNHAQGFGLGLGKHFVSQMLCAGPLSGAADHCFGDSGGPLACKRNGRYYLVGVVSWGRNCGEENLPGLYTRVSHYLDWIANEKLLLGPYI